MLLLVFLGSTQMVFCQTTITEPESVTQMLDMYEARNRENKEVQGWRIQIVATTDRRLMESTRSRFRSEFPDVKSKWYHKAPYYQLQAGAFATKREALPEIDKVKKKFPKAYLVVDRIPYKELN